MKNRKDIALIGVGMRMSHIQSLKEYWEVIVNGINCVSDFPQHRKKDIAGYAREFFKLDTDPEYYPGSFIDRIDEFDYEFFQISPREATLMDPVQRMFLEVVFHTFQDAGYSANMLDGTKTGVFLGYTSGSMSDNYLTAIALSNMDQMPYALAGNMAALIPSRASHYLNLKGPTMVLDTACSSALVSVHEACESIRSGICDMALAGGIKLHLLPVIDENSKIGIEEYNGRTRSFDNGATGASIGEGVIAVLLKPLEDAERDNDAIYAVIKGSAVNHDGTSSGLTAPNPVAQSQVLRQAWDNAGIDPVNLAYIEAHGTATSLGDPIEIQGITKALASYTSKKQFCAVSSSKSNMGHLYECAGLASILKAVCALGEKVIPANMHFLEPNASINFVNSPIYINTKTRHWEKADDIPRICGVSAFGIGGTNCHVVLEEYVPKERALPPYPSAKSLPQLFTLSAKTSQSLLRMAEQNWAYMQAHIEGLDFRQFCYNTNTLRDLYDHRLAILATDVEDLAAKISRILDCGQTDYEQISQPELGIHCHSLAKAGGNLSQIRKQRAEYGQRTAQISLLAENPKKTTEDLKEIAALYVLGGEISWESIYGDYQCPKQHLPLYAFEGHAMWLDNLRQSTPEPDIKKQYYQKCWIQQETRGGKNTINRIILLDLGSTWIGDIREAALRQCPDVVVWPVSHREGWPVSLGDKFPIVDPKTVFVLCPETLFGERAKTLDELKKSQSRNLKTLLALARGVSGSENAVQMFVLADNSFAVSGNEEEIKPEFTTLFGFGKGIRKENPGAAFGYFDLQNTGDIDLAMAEIACWDKREIICFRERKRYVEGLAEISLPQWNTQEDGAGRLKPGGVYLVTGGLGGIGYEISKRICQYVPDCTLLLLGRSELPQESTCKKSGEHNVELSIEQSIEQNDKQSDERISRYKELERLSQNLGYFAVDISDQSQVERVLAEARQRFGPLSGVIHGAGIGGGTDIDAMSWERIEELFASKVYGTWILDHATKGDPLDFFVMFSSIATVFSSSGLSGYAAANTFLDTYSSCRKKEDHGVTKTVNWSTWAQTGMSVKNDFTIDTLFKALNNEDGVQSFFDILVSSEKNVIAGELNLESSIALLLETYRTEYSPYIREKIDLHKNKKDRPKATDKSKAKADQPKASQGDSGTTIEVGEVIAHACREVLGYDEIDENDSFFELGADSILMSHIFNKIDEKYPGCLGITDLFEYPSVSMLASYLADKESLTAQRNSQSRQRLSATSAGGRDVAVIGAGFYLPCAETLDEYWELLSNGVNAVRSIPSERADCLQRHFMYMRLAGGNFGFSRIGYLDEIDKFDYELFGISPKDAKLMDPAARLTLQCCWKAIEDGGYGGERLKGANAGVFLGCTSNLGNMYSRMIFEADPVLFGDSLPVNQVSMIASRIAYVNDLKGPSMVIDTACSSSLVSINMAYEQIVSGKCDMALAGGVSLSLMPLETGSGDYRMGFESAGIKTRAFSEGSDGTAVGEGVGVVMLKTLESALACGDPIYAVIKGGAVNQDGSSFGIAAPNYLAQSEVIRKAWSVADVEPQSISYMEAHGTGTHLGDTLEVKGIAHAFSEYTLNHQFCALGSVKTNIGHLGEASGVSGLLKLLLMFRHKELLPSLHFSSPNPEIDLLHTPLYMVTKRMKWHRGDTPRRAGISGFGMSGTNCHLVLEEPPERPSEPAQSPKPYAILLSCQYKQGLKEICNAFYHWLLGHSDENIRDISYTLSVGRQHYAYRTALLADSRADLEAKLLTLTRQPLDQLEEDWFFRGYHKIVPESKQNRGPYEILAAEYNRLATEASQLLEEALTPAGLSGDTYAELLRLHVNGAKIDWEGIASIQEDKHYPVSLPPYPFQRKHVWVDVYDPEFDHMYYETTWLPEEPGEIASSTATQTFMVFVQTEALLDEIKSLFDKHQINGLFFQTGEGFQQLSDNVYRCGNQPENMAEAFQAVAHLTIDKIIFCSWGEDECSGLQVIDEQLNRGFYGLIALIKGSFLAHFNQSLEIVIISQTAYAISGREDHLIPANAAVLSLGKVIEQEYPSLQCRAIDTDRKTPLDCLIQEILRSDHQVYLVGYREGRRYCECFGGAPVQGTTRPIRQGGNYLITGGTGDIGAQTALYLSRSGCNSVILVSRHGFCGRDEWDSEDLSHSDKEKIRIFREIERGGVELRIAAVDICDYDGMKELLRDLRGEFGKLHGVFHGAGVAGAGFILRKERAGFESVLAPKIQGTLILDELTAEDPLDFMMLYSSAVTMSGEAGQSDYVAANAFLDAYCDYRNARGQKTFTVNWVSWKETGMSVRYGINVDTITRALPTALAIEGLDTLLGSDFRRVMIGQYTINQNLLAVTQYSRNRSSASMQELQEKLSRMFEFEPDKNVLLQSDREIATIDNGKLRILPYSKKMESIGRKSLGPKTRVETYTLEETQDNIASVYIAVLGYEEIDPYQNFFDMGGDSIMLTKMHNYIEAAYPGIITVADLFAYTSVEVISQYIFDTVQSSKK